MNTPRTWIWAALVLYWVGVAYDIAWHGFVDHVRRGRRGAAAPLAFVGGLLAATGEGYHAYSHLQLTTHMGPMAFFVGFIGMLMVLGALIATRRGAGAAPVDSPLTRP